MKKYIYFLLFILFTGCAKETKDIIIKGKVTGEAESAIVYTVPVNGFFYFGFRDTIPQPDASGEFEIRFSSDKAVAIAISMPGETGYRYIFTEPGQTYPVTINTEAGIIETGGENAKGQYRYNSLPAPSFIGIEAADLAEIKDPAQLQSLVEEMKEEDLQMFKEFLDAGDISKSYYKLIQDDRDCYYASLLAAALRNMINYTDDEASVMKLLSELYERYSPEDERFRISPYLSEYLSDYITEYCSGLNQPDMDANQFVMEIMRDQKVHTFIMETAGKYLKGEWLEHFQATYLWYECFSSNYEPGLPRLFKEFRNRYPNSNYIYYLTAYETQTEEYYRKLKEGVGESVVFLSGSEKFNSLKDATESLRGKKVYVDVWATWCNPCLREFEYSKELKELLKRESIESLYISIDDAKNEQKWKEKITYYQLSGNHILASERLQKDIRKIFGKNGGLSIPWFILIDEEGNIIKKHARRPSEIVAYEKETGKISF